MPNDAPPAAGATPPPPLEVLPPAPQAPPRRKKSAPAAFHLQVLQSNSQRLQSLTGSSSDCPPAPRPDQGVLFPQPAHPGPLSAAGAQADGTKETQPEAASLLGDYQDPFWNLLHDTHLLKNAWLSKNSDPLDPGTGSLERAHTASLQISASVADNLPPEHGPNDLGHWMTISDKDKRTVLQVFDPLAET